MGRFTIRTRQVTRRIVATFAGRPCRSTPLLNELPFNEASLANSSAAARNKFSDEHDQLAPDFKQKSSVLELENEALRLTLLQTETLMRETNHRVKNNLQMVSSLLRMQAELLRDHQAVAALRATQHRVLSMA